VGVVVIVMLVAHRGPGLLIARYCLRSATIQLRMILFNEKEQRIKTTMIDQDQNHDHVYEERLGSRPRRLLFSLI
jgi:hypothetical protein